MAMSETELKDWVKGLGIPEAEQGAIIASFAKPEVLKKVEGSILAQSEFSRRMDELKTKQSTLESEYQAKVKKEDEFRQSLTGWKTQKEKEIESQVVKAREEAEARLQDASKKIRALAEKNGIPEDEIKDIISTSAPIGTRQPEVTRDDKGRFTREDFNSEAQHFVKIPVIINKLDREYRSLFGNEAAEPNWEDVINKAQETKRSITDTFNDTYKLADKRKEIETAAHKKEVEEAETRGRQAERSALFAEHPELSGGGHGRGERAGSPVLVLAKKQAESGKPPEAKDPNRGAKAAAAAWLDGKYREGAA